MKKNKLPRSMPEMRKYIQDSMAEYLEIWLSKPDGYDRNSNMELYITEGIKKMINDSLGLHKSFGEISVERKNSELYVRISEVAKRTATEIMNEVNFGLTDKENKAVLKTVRKAFIEKLHEEAYTAAANVALRLVTDMIDSWTPEDSIPEENES